jgi:hypothetical protein
MQSTFPSSNGLIPGWTSTVQLQQPLVQPVQTVHASQLQPVVQPSQTQLFVVPPPNQGQYQILMNRTGYSNHQSNAAQMSMACQTWNSDQTLPTDSTWLHCQNETLRLKRQYQLLHSEYQSALIQIQTLTLQNTEIDKKLKMNQRNYLELNKKYINAIQLEQKKYIVLQSMHSETSNQLHREQCKWNALNIELEESTKNLKNEQQKYKFLNGVHDEAKKTLHSAQRHNDVSSVLSKCEGKHLSDKCKHNDTHLLLSKEKATMPNNIQYHSENIPEGSPWKVSTEDPRTKCGDKAFSGSSGSNNHLPIPPGFENFSRISG